MEIWRDVKGYEGGYQISSLGRVKSFKNINERILKQGVNKRGYKYVILSEMGVQSIKYTHQLVAIAFLNHKRCGMKMVVNHIDFNSYNNDVENLEIVAQRTNANLKHFKSSSKYVGVYWDKSSNKWRSQIHIKKKRKYLGSFSTELEASKAYQLELNKLTNG